MKPLNAFRRRAHVKFRRSLSKPRVPARGIRLVEPECTRSELGRRIIQVAKAEAPSDQHRQRVLDGVLAALRQLTSGAA